jgi:catechol 2,3-dioxygenase-like lactoylglutathione lyase family enzyme
MEKRPTDFGKMIARNLLYQSSTRTSRNQKENFQRIEEPNRKSIIRWKFLKNFFDSGLSGLWRCLMSSNRTVKLLRHAPYLPVSKVERSVAFYEQTLGFRCEYSAGTPLQFAICSRDGFAIMLRRVSAPELIVPSEKQGGTWDAFFWVNDAQGLYSELMSKGADIVYGPLVQQAYQMKEFAIRDCDGHVLGFGQALGS